MWFQLSFHTRLGVIATVLLSIAVISVVQSIHDPLHYRLSSVIKFAALMFVLWLAWKDLEKIPFWVYLCAPPVLIFCLWKPAAWLIVVPVVLFVLFTMPKR